MTSREVAPAYRNFDPPTLEILWGRLHGIADELWEAIRRTSFSSIVYAALDFGCAILDAKGSQLVNGGMSTFGLALPRITRDLLQRFGDRIYPGDVFIGNDPWICSGHLPDVAVMTPVFHRDKLVAFSVSIAHQADFGGVHQHKRVREVYEEGLFLPVMKLYDRGVRNDTLFEIIEANVRTSELVLGDLEAQVAANELGAQRVIQLLDEYQLDDPSRLATELLGRSEQAMREIIRNLPDGTYRAEGLADSQGRPTKIAVAITIAGDEIVVDYAGSADQLESGGVNCTLAFTEGATHYALKCVLAPEIPHNEGSTRPIVVTAPLGSILNCTFPSAVAARTRTALHIGPVLFAALAHIVPDRVMAGPGLQVSPRVLGSYPDGRGFNAPLFAGGGQGASKGHDGIGGYLFPSACSAVSIELFESACAAMITEKEWVADTAGAGEFRGGPATRISVRRLPGHSGTVRMREPSVRLKVPAPGMFNGRDGTVDHPTWNGEPIAPDSEFGRDGWAIFRNDSDELTFDVPSGGGYGDPALRKRSAIAGDIERGLLTCEGAERDYNYRR